MKYFAAIKEVSYAMIWKDLQNAQEEKERYRTISYFGVKRRKENKSILGWESLHIPGAMLFSGRVRLTERPGRVRSRAPHHCGCGLCFSLFYVPR